MAKQVRAFTAVATALVMVVVLVAQTVAQTAPWRIGQASDGTLLLVVGAVRYVVEPVQLADEEVAAMGDGGVIAGDQLPAPPERIVTREVVREVEVVVTATPVPTAPPAPPTATPVPAPAAAAPAPPPVEAPIEISGDGTTNTRPFGLGGGNYTVTWSARRPASERFRCAFFASLASVTSPAFRESLGNYQVTDSTTTGETQIYRVPRGDYYIDAGGSCSWSITIKAQR